MNVIVDAIRNKRSWEIKLDLFETHGDKPWMASNLRRMGPTWQSKATLDRELELLRWKKGLPKVRVQDVAAEEKIELPPQAEAGLYPKAIEIAIAVRGRAINARERAGRLLTQFHQDQTKEERAELVTTMKAQHAIVADQTRLIHHFQKTGKVLKEGELTEREQLEKEWLRLRNGLPGYRKNARIAKTEATRKLAEERLREKEARYEELRAILGKQKRRKRGKPKA